MKTLLFFFAGLLMCSGQISVGEEVQRPLTLSDGKHLGIEITYLEGRPNTYIILYQNRMYSIRDIRTIGFKASPKEMKSLYHEWDALYDSQSEKRYTLNDSEITAMPKGDVMYFYVQTPGETESFFSVKRKNLSKVFGL